MLVSGSVNVLVVEEKERVAYDLCKGSIMDWKVLVVVVAID